jgi:PAS domain-containing protein
VEINAWIQSKNEEIQTWISNYFPIVVDGSDTIEIAFTALEITQQKRLEKSLEAKKTELLEAGSRILRNFEHVPFSIAIHQGPDHVIVHANRKAREMLGTEDPIGKTVEEFIPQDYKSLKGTYDSVYKDAKTHIDREVIVNSINARGEKMVPSRSVWVGEKWRIRRDTRCCSRDVRRVWRGDRTYRSVRRAGSVALRAVLRDGGSFEA